jgi:hypothetical protein
MSTKTQQVLMAVIAALVVIGVCLVWRSCGTEAMVTCPNGGKAEITSRGSFEQRNSIYNLNSHSANCSRLRDVCDEDRGLNPLRCIPRRLSSSGRDAHCAPSSCRAQRSRS